MHRTETQPDDLTDDSPELVDAATSNDPTAEEVLRLLLTDRRFQNTIVHAITVNSPEVAKMIKAQAGAAVDEALIDAGVLTEGNIHASEGLYARFRESTYEQVWKVLREAGLAK